MSATDKFAIRASWLSLLCASAPACFAACNVDTSHLSDAPGRAGAPSAHSAGALAFAGAPSAGGLPDGGGGASDIGGSFGGDDNGGNTANGGQGEPGGGGMAPTWGGASSYPKAVDVCVKQNSIVCEKAFEPGCLSADGFAVFKDVFGNSVDECKTNTTTQCAGPGWDCASLPGTSPTNNQPCLDAAAVVTCMQVENGEPPASCALTCDP